MASAALEHAMDLTGSDSSSCSCASSSDESTESFVVSSLPPLPKPKVQFSETVTHIHESAAASASPQVSPGKTTIGRIDQIIVC